jgi:hypothetical protein
MKRSKQAAAARVHRIGIEIELHDVGRRHVRRRHRPGDEVAVGICGMTDADVAIGVEHPLIGENAICGDQILDQPRVHRGA